MDRTLIQTSYAEVSHTGEQSPVGGTEAPCGVGLRLVDPRWREMKDIAAVVRSQSHEHKQHLVHVNGKWLSGIQ